MSSVCFAAEDITENPSIQLLIEGKLVIPADVPIIKNGSTLLPLRSILTTLGVQNDDKHIIWNGEDRSITIIKEVAKGNSTVSKKIFLKIGSNVASIDNADISLDAEAMIYNDKTYIPVRFVSQSLGKKVAWDGKSSMILIRDEDEFNKTKDLLGKINTALNSSDRIKEDIASNTSLSLKDKKVVSDLTLKGETDLKNKISHASLTSIISGRCEKHSHFRRTHIMQQRPLFKALHLRQVDKNTRSKR